MMSIFKIIIIYSPAFIKGLGVTISLSGIAWGAGLILGIPLGSLANRHRSWIGRPLRIISFVIAAIPPIVLLYWAHYPLQVAFNIVINPFITASAIFSIINIIIVAEIIRSALSNFRNEYKIAAQVSGLDKKNTFRFIELPIIFRQVLPTILASQVLILQMTLFASLISVDEIFRVVQQINSYIYQPIQIYTALAVFFLVVCLPLYLLAYILNIKFTRDYSEK